MDLIVQNGPPAGTTVPNDEPLKTLMSLGLQFKWETRK